MEGSRTRHQRLRWRGHRAGGSLRRHGRSVARRRQPCRFDGGDRRPERWHAYDWRLRIASWNPYFPRSPWMSVPGNSITETKLLDERSSRAVHLREVIRQLDRTLPPAARGVAGMFRKRDGLLVRIRPAREKANEASALGAERDRASASERRALGRASRRSGGIDLDQVLHSPRVVLCRADRCCTRPSETRARTELGEQSRRTLFSAGRNRG